MDRTRLSGMESRLRELIGAAAPTAGADDRALDAVVLGPVRT
jgi:hypothetical protein